MLSPVGSPRQRHSRLTHGSEAAISERGLWLHHSCWLLGGNWQTPERDSGHLLLPCSQTPPQGSHPVTSFEAAASMGAEK